MDLALLVYGISLLGKISGFFGVTIFIAACCAIGSGIYRATECTEESWYGETTNAKRKAKAAGVDKFLKRSIIAIVLAAWGMILLPDEKTAYTMVAAYAAQKVTENGKVQELSSKVLTIIDQKMDQFIEEGTKELNKKADKAMKDAKDKVDGAIREQLSHKDIGQVGVRFMQFCGKYELNKCSEFSDQFGRWLNETYKGVLNDNRS